MKIDLARQKEELERREKAITRRENNHRSILHLQGLVNMKTLKDINFWTVEDVAGWLPIIAATAPESVDLEIVDKLVACIYQYEIDGPRLLNVSSTDLQKLGIEKGTFCDFLLDSIKGLKTQFAYDFVEFPTLRMSSIIERRNASFRF